MQAISRHTARRFVSCVVASMAYASGVSVAAPPLTMTPVTTIEIPHSKGKFDFLRIDAKRNRLLAAHENDGTADYIDLKTRKLITRLKVGGAVDTAMDGESKTYYLSVQDSKRVAFVDAKTLKETASVKTPGPTDAIVYEPNNRLVYVTHDDGAEVWVIDPVTAKLTATVAIPGVPEVMVYDAVADRIYLNIKNKDLVAVIDPKAGKVIAQWPTAPAQLPHGMALDADQHRIFVAGGNGKLSVIDVTSGLITDSVDIVPKVDQIAFDAHNKLVYCAGTDRMSVVATAGTKAVALGDFPTAASARNVAVDPATHEVWTTFTDGTNSFARAWMPPQNLPNSR